MSDKTYTDLDALEELKRYFIYKFDLEENKNDIMIFYNDEFWFSARTKSTMDRIGNIGLNEIYKSCNSIDCSDDSFYDEEDLLEELNSLVDCKNIVEYMKNYLEEVYGATCISE